MIEHVKFEDLTKAEKKDICNGCGGKGGWIKPPLAAFFKTDCDHHDYGYWKGNTEAHRKQCDKKLKESMKKDCDKLPWYKQPLYRPWCYLYYRGVRVVGADYFYYGKIQRSIIR